MELSQQEFFNRTKAIAAARKIFIPHITKNISIAFKLYQEVLAEEKLDTFISTAIGGNRPPSPFDDIDRPRCDDCDLPLRLKINATDQAGKIWPTAWVCECGLEYYSERSVQEWYEELNVSEE